MHAPSNNMAELFSKKVTTSTGTMALYSLISEVNFFLIALFWQKMFTFKIVNQK